MLKKVGKPKIMLESPVHEWTHFSNAFQNAKRPAKFNTHTARIIRRFEANAKKVPIRITRPIIVFSWHPSGCVWRNFELWGVPVCLCSLVRQVASTDLVFEPKVVYESEFLKEM